MYQKEKILRFLEKYSNDLLGLKIRQSKEIVGDFGIEPAREMIKIAEEAKCSVVVHTTNPPGKQKILLNYSDQVMYMHMYIKEKERVL